MKKISCVILLFAMTVSVFSGCSNAETGDMEELTSITTGRTDGATHQSDFYGAPIECFLSIFDEAGDCRGINSVEITEHFYGVGENIYLAKVTREFMWASELYLVSVSNNKITDIVYTGLGGLTDYFSYDITEMSQGIYVWAYCSSHSGNGELDLVSIENLGTVKYTIPNAVDAYFERNGVPDAEYTNSSDVYLGGKLHAEFIDLNNDGSTDIMLTGIQQIYEEEEKETQDILRKEFYIKNVYLYDFEKDEFIFSDELSKRDLINAY